MSKKSEHQHTQKLMLYEVVFHSRFVKSAVYLLLTVLLIQPIAPLYADEESAVDTSETTTATTKIAEPDPEPDHEVSSIAQETAESKSANTNPSAEDISLAQIADEDTEDAESSPSESIDDKTGADYEQTTNIEKNIENIESDEVSEEETTESISKAHTSTSEPTDEDHQTSVTDSDNTTSDKSLDTPSAPEAAVSDDLEDKSNDNKVDKTLNIASTTEYSSTTDTQIATTTASATPPNLLVQPFAQNEKSYYQFGRNDCVAVGDGSFYCGSTTKDVEDSTDSIFAAPDKDGDLEIYLNLNGELSQLTDNNEDDAAPYYDPVSNSVVWHRLSQNDRYQIITLDLDSGEESQITHDAVNNMEPSRYGDYIVWQRWVNNWEIILYDGSTTTQLTKNDIHDIAPSVNQNYVVWKTIVGDTQKIITYDLLSGKTQTLTETTDSDAVANMRLLYVFDSYTDTGDVITSGFDPKTGTLVPLNTIPTRLPDTLPKSDQTGETRALIQSKVTGDREVVKFNDDGNNDLAKIASTTATQTDIDDPYTVVLASATSDITEPSASTTRSNIPDIPDVVIPPIATTSPSEIE